VFLKCLIDGERGDTRLDGDLAKGRRVEPPPVFGVDLGGAIDDPFRLGVAVARSLFHLVTGFTGETCSLASLAAIVSV
jgi:hypothetical protein